MQKLSSDIKIEQLKKELSDCRKLLAESRNEMDAFINIAAHDLKAPFRKITSLIDILINKSTIKEQENLRVYAEKIFKSVADANNMIDRLSVCASMDDKNISFAKTDLLKLLREVLKEQEQIINNNNVEIEIENLPVLEINVPQIKTVFFELLDNAIKFKKADKNSHIKINSYILTLKEKEIYNLAVSTIYHRIEFKDNGIGLVDDIHDKIFEPFYKYHGKSAYTGSGMGLAVIRKIMKNHHGLIFSVPNEAEGVRMNLIFPETI